MPRFHRGPMRVVGLLCAVFALGILELPSAWAQAEPVAAERTVSFDIPAQGLASALTAFASQSGQEMFYLPEMAAGKSVAGISGSMTLDQAMAALLADTGLEFERTPNNAILIGDHEALSTLRAQLKAREESRQDASGNAAGGIGDSSVAQASPDADAAASSPASVETVQHGGIEEIIVTGQKKAENIQDVPIAISAFSTEDLRAQKLEGGFDLLKAIPNVTFSKTNFTGYNFQIRGIGTQAISATTDPAVAVSQNDTTLIVNRLFEQEYLDIERVEVLRGPQGTLFGRNATGGVINVIPATPKIGVTESSFKYEAGNYGASRFTGMINQPLSDSLAIRGAYASTKRDGFDKNEFDGSNIDGRDLSTGRVTLGWKPTDKFHANLSWEHFNENDDRLRSAKNLCHRDPGPDQVGGFDVAGNPNSHFIRSLVEQGCVAHSLYDKGSYETPNGDALPFVTAGRVNGTLLYTIPSGQIGKSPFPAVGAPCPTAANNFLGNTGVTLINPCLDVFASPNQSHDLRSVYSALKPEYRAKADLFDLSFDYQWTDDLQFTSHTVYDDDNLYSTEDFTRYAPTQGLFTDTADPAVAIVDQRYNIAPGGVFCDPQLGCSTGFLAQDVAQSKSTQLNQQFQLVSSFSGPWNFSAGVNYTHFKTQVDYFVFSNLLTALIQVPPFDGPRHSCTILGTACVGIQQDGLKATTDNPYGHNFFLSQNPYALDSAGLFGEVYYQATDTLKFNLGLRYTWDRKQFSPVPSQTLLADYREGNLAGLPSVPPNQGAGPEACDSTLRLCAILGDGPGGVGYPANPDIVQTWRVPTGRFVVNWTPDLPFTDQSMFYASYSRGYKGGGANPPSIAPPAGLFIQAAQGAVAPPTFKAEYVNAFELGTKNTLLNGGMTLNADVFYYGYENYQVSKIVDRTAANENFDATIFGAEVEALFAPTLDWNFNASIGYLHTSIAKGEKSIDLMDRTQGGNQFYVTQMKNPNFDPSQTPRPVSEYVAGLTGAPSDQEYLAFDDWVVLKPNATQASNCIAPADIVAQLLQTGGSNLATLFNGLNGACPAGALLGATTANSTNALVKGYDSKRDAPNGSAGFFADLGGNELPNSPHFTVSLGTQYTFHLPAAWDLTTRADWYWQDKSYARVYNTEYDRLRAWTNTNFSIWAEKVDWGLRVEAYVKNVFNKTPITGSFLNSDDTALTTNVFTLDPRLIGVSITKNF